MAMFLYAIQDVGANNPVEVSRW